MPINLRELWKCDVCAKEVITPVTEPDGWVLTEVSHQSETTYTLVVCPECVRRALHTVYACKATTDNPKGIVCQ
jgi:hypothetical protein